MGTAEISTAPMERERAELKLDEIGIDPKLQPREAIDGRRVAQYAEAMRGGARFPAVLVCRVSDRLGWFLLAHGFHRYHASKEVGRKTIDAEIMVGTYQDARWAAAGSNKEWDGVGLPRGDGDKRRAVRMAWEARPLTTQRRIAEQVGVTAGYVGQLMKRWNSDCAYSKHGEIQTSTDNEADDPGVVNLAPPLSDEARQAYLEKERERWPSEMASRNWNKAVSEITELMASFRRHGGVAALTQDWHPDRVRQLLGHAGDIRRQFEELVDEIEARLPARD